MKNLLGVLDGLQQILGVRERVSSVKVPQGWAAVEEIFGPIQVHDELLANHIKNRTMGLIASELEKIFTEVNESLCELDKVSDKEGLVSLFYI